ncbi:helix-turn-helix domain-containing protein [Candidatus Solirubrobacter pratensis]|uniref:helix-turn-helix domain-containing protein n=1 Tax=Candidatus Solirubrobacter pratensis TaxID=1298857 RepID=UPI0009DBCD70|nr:helix-turn-helix transcriptional regulator [Candidatus Solirubrobacter pratensis]
MSLPVRSSSRIAGLRRRAGLRQDELAETVGVSVATLRRLERGEIDNPPLRYLQKIAIALDAQLADVIEPEWRQWWPRPGANTPPDFGAR